MSKKRHVLLVLVTLLAAVPHLDAMENEAPQNHRKRPSRWDQEVPVSTILANQRQLSQELVNAARTGNQQETQKLLNQGADPNVQSPEGELPLIVAAGHDLESVMLTLLGFGAKIDMKDRQGQTALLAASESSSVNALALLIASGADIDIRNNDNKTALDRALSNGGNQKACILLLMAKDRQKKNPSLNTAPEQPVIAPLASQSSPSSNREHPIVIPALSNPDPHMILYNTLCTAIKKDNPKHLDRFLDTLTNRERIELLNYQDKKNGYTILHKVAKYGGLKKIRLLLTAGANIYLTDKAKRTPLIHAVFNGSSTLMCLLTQSISDQSTRAYYVNKKDIEHKTALDWAAYLGNNDAIDQLIAAGADTTLTDRKGKNSLHWAAYNGHTAAVARLIANNVYDAPDREGRTALHWAAAHGYPEIVAMLFTAVQNEQKMAYINHQDNEGQTPLFLAARYEHSPVITVLRKHGAANIPNFYGETAIEDAARRNKKITLETLMQTGLQDIPDGRGRTAVSYAAEVGLLQAVKILLESGAHDIPDYQGKTGLTWALENNQCGTTRALSEYWQKAAPLILQQAGIDRDALQSAEEEASATVKKRHIQDSENDTHGECYDLPQ